MITQCKLQGVSVKVVRWVEMEEVVGQLVAAVDLQVATVEMVARVEYAAVQVEVAELVLVAVVRERDSTLEGAGSQSCR
jgi:hypothetical protein